MSNPLDQYLEKKANPGFGSSFRKAVTDPTMLGHMAAGTALAAGLGAVGPAAQKIIGAITKQRDFKAMLHHSPDLAQERDRNPELFNQQYTSLRRLNPVFASDPIIAGTYMRRMSMSPESAGAVIVESLKGVPEAARVPHWAETGMRQFSPPESPKPVHPEQLAEMQLRKQKLEHELADYMADSPIRGLRREKQLSELQQHFQSP